MSPTSGILPNISRMGPPDGEVPSFLSSMPWRRQQVMPTDRILDVFLRVLRKHNVSGRRNVGVFAGACGPTGHDTHSPQSPRSAGRHPKKHSQSLPRHSRGARHYFSMTCSRH